MRFTVRLPRRPQLARGPLPTSSIKNLPHVGLIFVPKLLWRWRSQFLQPALQFQLRLRHTIIRAQKDSWSLSLNLLSCSPLRSVEMISIPSDFPPHNRSRSAPPTRAIGGGPPAITPTRSHAFPRRQDMRSKKIIVPAFFNSQNDVAHFRAPPYPAGQWAHPKSSSLGSCTIAAQPYTRNIPFRKSPQADLPTVSRHLPQYFVLVPCALPP